MGVCIHRSAVVLNRDIATGFIAPSQGATKCNFFFLQLEPFLSESGSLIQLFNDPLMLNYCPRVIVMSFFRSMGCLLVWDSM